MSISDPFIRRPVGTSLLGAAVLMAGALAYTRLPVAPLPQVEFPTISVSASLPGAHPETMASSVATPLERQFGRIAGVTQMTSSSSSGSTNVTLQFDLDRNIDAAARDVQAAINAARGQLPANLPTNPNWRKVNPADAPIMILALTSDVQTQAQMYDVADSILAQKIAQIDGIGQVFVGGSWRPAVRVELNPLLLSKLNVGVDAVRTALSAANANRPKGEIAGVDDSWIVKSNDQLFKANQYRSLIVASRDGKPVILNEVADVVDSVENINSAGSVNGKTAISLVLCRQPGANIIGTVDRVTALMPQLQAAIPPSIHLESVLDRTTTIRASIVDVERTLAISILLVVLVVFLFLRSGWATMIPSVAVPLSIVGTFGVMYLLGYSLDNLSLMALTISTGFVIDDAIVVIENITRFIEEGHSPLEAALMGSKQIGFTIVSLTVSLIAVLIPLLFMGDIVGRLFREFAVTLSVTILVSAVVSLTLTPMMSAKLLKPERRVIPSEARNPLPAGDSAPSTRLGMTLFDRVIDYYGRTLQVVLRHRTTTLLVTLATLITTIVLYIVVPKGFFPLQDTGVILGISEAPEDVSFRAMAERQLALTRIVTQDPAVASVSSFIGVDGTNMTSNVGRIQINLKPLGERGPVILSRADGEGSQPTRSFASLRMTEPTASAVIRRLQPKLADVAGITLYMQPVQDLSVESRVSRTQYQYT